MSVYTDPKYFPNATSMPQVDYYLLLFALISFSFITLANYLRGQVNKTNFYQTKVNTSYKCSSESLIHIPINDSLNNTTALITVKHFQLEAFRIKHGEEFSRGLCLMVELSCLNFSLD